MCMAYTVCQTASTIRIQCNGMMLQDRVILEGCHLMGVALPFLPDWQMLLI